MTLTRTLLAHEWLAPHGGSENVFEQMAAALPEASLRCIWNDAPDRFGSDIDESWLARTPLRRSKAASLVALSAAARSVSLGSYDRVIVSSHAFSHHLATKAAREGLDAFAYVHSPARYVWVPELDERGGGRLARAAAHLLRRHDRGLTSPEVHYAANSQFVCDRIRAAWGRDSTVIYPPVAVERIQSKADWSDELSASERDGLERLPAQFVLGASRLIEYKRLDLTMRAGEALGLPVVIAGGGPLEAVLREQADSVGVPVHFVGRVSDPFLYALYQQAILFVFMAVEDFGIMPVEAMAAGTPVVVNAVGGAAESAALVGGGVAISSHATSTEFADAAIEALRLDPAAVSARARELSEQRFRERFRDWSTR